MDSLGLAIERWKAAAEIFMAQDIEAFIEDASGNFYFGKILLVGEKSLVIECTGPKRRAGEKHTLYWPLIIKFQASKEEGE